MARKLRIQLRYHPAVQAIFEAYATLCEVGRWPKRLGTRPIVELDDRVDAIEEEEEQLQSLLEQLEAVAKVEETDDGYDVGIDLLAVLAGPRRAATENGWQVSDFLHFLRELTAFEVTVKVGGEIATPAAGDRALRATAKTLGVRIPRPQVIIETDSLAEDEDEDDEDDAEPDDESAAEDADRSQWEWGGLDEDDEPPLTEEELFFLAYTGLSWPVDEAELSRVRKKAAHELHPDKQRGNAHAASQFVRFQAGYDALRKR